jgi:hypothetical protein
MFVMESLEAQRLHRDLLSDVIPIVSIFLIVGTILSIAQALRVRRRTASL